MKNDDFVPLKVPENIEEILNDWVSDDTEKIGWCLLCNRPIRTEADLIPRTNTHNCARGWELELKSSNGFRGYPDGLK
jgi:hypothetical protein